MAISNGVMETNRAWAAMASIMAAVVLIIAGVLANPTPAHATGMKSVTGNISCKAYPNISIGTSATARGDVRFQLNQPNNTGSLAYVSLGYSSNYASWSWKFWFPKAGNFYAYGYGSKGNVTAASRWCHNING